MTQELAGDSLAALVGSIYESALEPDRWAITLPRLVAAVHGERGVLGFTAIVRGRGQSRSMFAHEIDPQGLRRWEEDFSGFDPWFDRCGPLATGAVVRGFEILPWDELRALTVHAELFQPFGIDELLIASVGNQRRVHDFMTVHRSRRRGPFGDAEAQIMRLLAPHLVRAAELHDKLSSILSAHAAQEWVLDRLPYGVVMLDSRGRLLRTNREAERILTSDDGLGARNDAIHARDLATQKKLAQAIAETCAAGGRASTVGGMLLAVPRQDARPYQVLLVPVSGPSRERVSALVTNAAAVMVVSDPEIAPEPTAAALRRLFALTPANARLAAALAAGRTLAEYAEDAAISLGTARWHLKELFARTSTRRQSELVRLLLTSVAQVCLDPTKGSDG